MKPPKLQFEIQAYRNLQSQITERWPDIDDETLADTLEGITSLNEMIAELVRSALDDEALEGGLKTRIEAMKKRHARLKRRAEKKRALALTAMLETDLQKVSEPDFTVSTRAGTPGLIIQAEEEIPDPFWIPQAPKLDRQSLLIALKNGHAIDGVTLSNAEPTLSVRTK